MPSQHFEFGQMSKSPQNKKVEIINELTGPVKFPFQTKKSPENKTQNTSNKKKDLDQNSATGIQHITLQDQSLKNISRNALIRRRSSDDSLGPVDKQQLTPEARDGLLAKVQRQMHKMKKDFEAKLELIKQFNQQRFFNEHHLVN